MSYGDDSLDRQCDGLRKSYNDATGPSRCRVKQGASSSSKKGVSRAGEYVLWVWSWEKGQLSPLRQPSAEPKNLHILLCVYGLPCCVNRRKWKVRNTDALRTLLAGRLNLPSARCGPPPRGPGWRITLRSFTGGKCMGRFESCSTTSIAEA